MRPEGCGEVFPQVFAPYAAHSIGVQDLFFICPSFTFGFFLLFLCCVIRGAVRIGMLLGLRVFVVSVVGSFVDAAGRAGDGDMLGGGTVAVRRGKDSRLVW